MTYIRTKEGIYELANEKTITEFQVIDHLHNRAFLKSDIIAQADSIEELCDEFVIVNRSIHQTTKALNKIKEYFNPYDTFYGAIWTDKGLIYVAKMNSKGELELI